MSSVLGAVATTGAGFETSFATAGANFGVVVTAFGAGTETTGETATAFGADGANFDFDSEVDVVTGTGTDAVVAEVEESLEEDWNKPKNEGPGFIGDAEAGFVTATGATLAAGLTGTGFETGVAGTVLTGGETGAAFPVAATVGVEAFSEIGLLDWKKLSSDGDAGLLTAGAGPVLGAETTGTDTDTGACLADTGGGGDAFNDSGVGLGEDAGDAGADWKKLNSEGAGFEGVAGAGVGLTASGTGLTVAGVGFTATGAGFTETGAGFTVAGTGFTGTGAGDDFATGLTAEAIAGAALAAGGNFTGTTGAGGAGAVTGTTCACFGTIVTGDAYMIIKGIKINPGKPKTKTEKCKTDE